VSAPGVNVLGYLREAKGIGEAARLYASALAAAGVPVRTGAVDAGFSPSAGQEHESVEGLSRSADHPVDLICLNAPELRRFLDGGGRLPGSGHRIGVWAWEVDRVPPEWAETARELDEIWVYSRFVAELLGRALPVPVVVVPLPILAPDLGPEPLPATGAGFTFLFMFDFHSMLQRKNPLGLIEAYTRAFDAGEGARLLIKTFNGDQRPGDLAALRDATGGRADVEVVDEYVGVRDKDRLLAGCDCYVSLHRAEGFGLTLGEAMVLGRPVIATGYSGNLDFMPPGIGHLVRWDPAEVGAGVEVYPQGARWAEPDTADAARLMRAVFDDRDAAASMAARGRELIERDFSTEAVGEIAARRLEALTAARRRGPLARVLGRR
jgi:glycosyltransferase involved in cell wall biosynthesis